jgi:hypothetical protein
VNYAESMVMQRASLYLGLSDHLLIANIEFHPYRAPGNTRKKHGQGPGVEALALLVDYNVSFPHIVQCVLAHALGIEARKSEMKGNRVSSQMRCVDGGNSR